MTDQPTSTLHGETSPDATTLGDLVTANPTAAQVLQRHGLDFCCGGRSTLAEACQKADVDSAVVLAENRGRVGGAVCARTCGCGMTSSLVEVIGA